MSKTFIQSAPERPFLLDLEAPGSESLRRLSLRAGGITLAGFGYESVRPRQTFHSLNITLAGFGVFESGPLRQELSPGIAWLNVAGTNCRYRGPSDPAVTWRSVWFHLLDAGMWSELRGQLPHAVAAPQAEQLEAAVRGHLQEGLRIEQSPRILAAYSDLIAVFLDRILLRRQRPDSPSGRQLEELASIVHEDLGAAWTTPSLAARLGVSVSCLYRWMRQHHRCAPMQWVTRVRMESAEKLLRDSDCTLAQLSEMLGYETPFAFSKAFKRHAGISPRIYQDRWNSPSH